jgi:7-cyano-7-deazaguanine reductase|tara:strand:+ start:208 stop:588 length:381 start_codon:yes stop_codon:yes gene_type:complete
MTVLKTNKRVLKKITNPALEPYEIEIDAPEFTFYGAKNQPDYATITITMIPGKSVIELKSFKSYLQQYRNQIASYERVINVIYDDLIQVYKPKRLLIEMKFRPRGGITSKLAIDSFERELFIERER